MRYKNGIDLVHRSISFLLLVLLTEEKNHVSGESSTKYENIFAGKKSNMVCYRRISCEWSFYLVLPYL